MRYFLCIPTFISLLLLSMVGQAQVPTNGLVAYYPFTGNANDASGNNRNGAVSFATLTSDRNGVANQAYFFNGSSASISVSNWSILTGNSARSICLWFKTTTPGSANQVMVSWGANSTNAASFIGIINNNPKLLGFFGFGNDIAVADQNQYYDNRWHQLTFTYDGSGMNLYLDGVLMTTRNPVTPPLATGTTNLVFGYYIAGGNVYAGSLDEIRIYNRALSPTEVQQLYLAEAPATVSATDVIRLGNERFVHATGTGNTFAGFRAAAFAQGTNSTFLGQETGLNSTGVANVFVGYLAGNKNTSGGNNTFIGSFAGQENRTGTHNIYMGNGSGMFNNSGSFNTSIGVFAGQFATGSLNTFMGYGAGYSTTSSEGNTYIGYGSGFYATGRSNTYLGGWSGIGQSTTIVNAGNFNTYIGLFTGRNTTTGTNNVFVGYQAGRNNTTGSNNTVVGPNSGTTITTGNDNVLMGYNTRAGDGEGHFNTVIGTESGGGLWAGNSNTLIGHGATAESPILENATAIGAKAKVSASNAIVLGNQANVGIGTSAPQARLEINSGRADESGLMLSSLTNRTIARQTANQFLSVDVQGRVGLYGLNASQITLRPQSPDAWADRVFASGYRLMPLSEVARYVQTYKHLPNMPSAKEMVETGMSVEQTSAKLLEKVEELTSYVIQIKAELERTQKELQQVKKQQKRRHSSRIKSK